MQALISILIHQKNILQVVENKTQTTRGGKTVPEIWFELCSGNLLKYCQDYTNIELLDILCQCLSGLEYLHSMGITHRDIKPENILIKSRDDRGYQVVLGDFGLAKQSVLHYTEVGTPFYQAPEVRDRYGNSGSTDSTNTPKPYDASVDIWSLGVTFYELAYAADFAGRPSHLKRPKSLARNLEKQIATAGEDSLPRLLCHMLQIDPKNRPSARTCHERATNIYLHEVLLREVPSASTSLSHPQNLRKRKRGEKSERDSQDTYQSCGESTTASAECQMSGSLGVGSTAKRQRLNDDMDSATERAEQSSHRFSS